MRLAALVALVVMAALTPLHAAAAGRVTRQGLAYRSLAAPQGGDDFMFRQAFHQNAQGLSDRLFAAVQKALGGTAPELNFVQEGTGGVENDVSANLTDRPGFAKGSINIDPTAVQALIDENNTFHDAAVNAMPHEMMHTRQTPGVLASIPDREGGAQAFADIVTPLAAAAAKTHYNAGSYDGAYVDFVKAARARGNDWIFGGQMGKPPIAWP